MGPLMEQAGDFPGRDEHWKGLTGYVTYVISAMDGLCVRRQLRALSAVTRS
jgi:hypothetical protein